MEGAMLNAAEPLRAGRVVDRLSARGPSVALEGLALNADTHPTLLYPNLPLPYPTECLPGPACAQVNDDPAQDPALAIQGPTLKAAECQHTGTWLIVQRKIRRSTSSTPCRTLLSSCTQACG